MRCSFGPHTLDTDRRELIRGPDRVEMEPQVFDLLVFLVENRDRVVSKDDLLEAVWGGRVVSESTLTTRINAARTAIGDSGKQQDWIRTFPRRGFRFVGDVEVQVTESSVEPKQVVDPEDGSSREQEIRFCTAHDGVRIAYAEVGSGPVLVKAANWLNHLELDWDAPIWSPLFQQLARTPGIGEQLHEKRRP